MTRTPADPAKLATPNVTAAQILAIITGVVGFLVGFGLVDNNHAQILIGAASTVIPAVIVLADSIIRHGRAVGNTTK